MSEKLDCLDHVLAVDDSPVDRKVIEHLLKNSSCEVIAVNNGLQALQFLGLNEEDKSSSGGFDGLKVDLIITDYCMPGMTGYELLKKIKQSSTFKDIPVVITSSENILERIDKYAFKFNSYKINYFSLVKIYLILICFFFPSDVWKKVQKIL